MALNGSELADLAKRVGESLQPEANLGRLDMAGFGTAFRRFLYGTVRHPRASLGAATRLGAGLTAASLATASRAFGGDAEPVITPEPKDKRFTDGAWDENAFYFGLQQSYLLASRFAAELLEAADVKGFDRVKADFFIRMLTDAMAPTNTLAGNPQALRKAFDTGGISVMKGMRNFLDDLRHNGGMPRQVDTTGVTVGENMAATPGKVVFRNKLMELLQYEPQTETTYEVPLVLSPPWINKYYIMDLAPGRSFAEWAVQQGHTTFVISYRNPDETMRDVTLDDYLVHGPAAALDVISEITGQPRVNVVGLCLGGTLTTILLAYLAHRGDDRVNSATLLNTLVDFSEPGMLGVFTDEPTVRRLEKSMKAKGYLEAKQMASTFDFLRANDLIWSYVANNWLMGEQPPAFDLLAWNGDSTRMPAAMHSFYLRSCYLQNQLARDAMEIAGSPLKLTDIAEEVYVLAAVDDHIAPWRSQYRTTQLLKSTRFTLSTSGHIAGIVNPPSPKAGYWSNDELPEDPEMWMANATQHRESWWEDWARWMSTRAGDRGTPPPMGSKDFPALGPAPGTYVLS